MGQENGKDYIFSKCTTLELAFGMDNAKKSRPGKEHFKLRP
jgi:hypothetical protein